jgi:2-keto-4-pentenoate hydratase/2-oxohepta-3-ene-1,7-dioic acid hydratase in catechol pathway
MKLLKYTYESESCWGVLQNDWDIHAIKGDMFGDFNIGEKVADVESVKILAPFDGGQVIGLALNYPGIAGAKFDDDAEPLVFNKGANTVIGDGADIVFPKGMADEMWVEVELSFMVGKIAKNVPPEKAHEYILGYTIGNDVTCDTSKSDHDHHLPRFKSFDTFSPLGPYIDTEFDASNAELITRVNDKIVQQGNANTRHFDDAKCLSLVSKIMTLYPGDVILTGTPAGAGPGEASVVNIGDKVELEIKGLGVLRHQIK